MAEALERDLYHGGDLFIGADGKIDYQAASNPNGPVRQLRGIIANVREGDKSMRGVPGDFIGFGNNRSVIFDARGQVLNRKLLDEIVTAVRDSRGSVKEAHCTTSMLAEFRATFFPFERGSLADAYAIRGAGVTNDEKVGLPIDSCQGTVNFIPTVFKYNDYIPQVVTGSAGTPPSTPSCTPSLGGTAAGSGFVVGQKYAYKVQACNISGASVPAQVSAQTVSTNDANISIAIVPNGGTVPEYYKVFRTPVEANGTVGKEFYVGKVLADSAGNANFVDNNRVIPGLDSVLFLPVDKARPKLLTLGNLLNKTVLGRMGLAEETVYSSYVGCMVDRPRNFAVLQNVFQKREGL